MIPSDDIRLFWLRKLYNTLPRISNNTPLPYIENIIGTTEEPVYEYLVANHSDNELYYFEAKQQVQLYHSPGTWVTGETPAQQLAPVIPWLSQNKSASKWYLIGNDYNWPRDTNAAAKGIISNAGGSIVGEEYVPLGSSDFDASLQRIKSSGANAVLVTLVGGDSVGFNIAYGAFGLDKQALRLGTLIEENTLAGIGAAGSNNLFASMGYFANIETTEAKAFGKRYTDEFGADAAALNGLGQSTYDGLMLLAALANAAGSMDVSKINTVADGTSFSSPRGSATLSGNHVAQTVYLADGQGGRFSVIETFENVPHGVDCK